MNPKPILGLPNLETDSGSPCSNMGIVFLVFFFQSRTRSAFSHQKLRQSRLHCAAAATAAAAAATTAATSATTAGRHASSVATASNSLSCRLLFSPRPPPSHLLVSSVVAPIPTTMTTMTTTTTTMTTWFSWHQRQRRPHHVYVASGIGRRVVPPSIRPPPPHRR